MRILSVRVPAMIRRGPGTGSSAQRVFRRLPRDPRYDLVSDGRPGARFEVVEVRGRDEPVRVAVLAAV